MKALPRIVDALAAHLGHSVASLGHRPVRGGCINDAIALRTDHGTFFVKTNAAHLPGLFSAEGAGLEAMRASGTSLVIPEVLGLEDPEPGRPGFLILEMLEPGRRRADFDASFGRGLAELHRSGSPAGFGFARKTYCGTVVQPNAWSDRWIEFYRDARLGHQLRLAVDDGLFDSAARKLTERLLARLDDRLDSPSEPPALIHGDLWSGNLHVTSDGRPALIDPAAYYGHREAEWGMMMLFGGFDAEVLAAYQEAYPLAEGWQTRNPLYQLYHVMNHANLFGSGYVPQALGIIRKFA